MKNGLEKFYDLVEAFESLPTIGKKSALRLAYHIVHNDTFCGLKLAHSIEDAIKTVKKCTSCGSISEHEICDICLDEYRDAHKLCIVQNAKDIFVIEESHQYTGKYFVIDEIDEYNINSLINFVYTNEVNDVLFAITPSLANDAFILYIEQRLEKFDINFTKIAQGVPTGVSLENVDILSLAKAIDGKVSI
jgi:recombination protein RecR